MDRNIAGRRTDGFVNDVRGALANAQAKAERHYENSYAEWFDRRITNIFRQWRSNGSVQLDNRNRVVIAEELAAAAIESKRHYRRHLIQDAAASMIRNGYIRETRTAVAAHENERAQINGRKPRPTLRDRQFRLKLQAASYGAERLREARTMLAATPVVQPGVREDVEGKVRAQVARRYKRIDQAFRNMMVQQTGAEIGRKARDIGLAE